MRETTVPVLIGLSVALLSIAAVIRQKSAERFHSEGIVEGHESGGLGRAEVEHREARRRDLLGGQRVREHGSEHGEHAVIRARSGHSDALMPRRAASAIAAQALLHQLRQDAESIRWSLDELQRRAQSDPLVRAH